MSRQRFRSDLARVSTLDDSGKGSSVYSTEMGKSPQKLPQQITLYNLNKFVTAGG